MIALRLVIWSSVMWSSICVDSGLLDSIELGLQRSFYTDIKTATPYVVKQRLSIFYQVNRRPNLPAYRYLLKTERREFATNCVRPCLPC